MDQFLSKNNLNSIYININKYIKQTTNYDLNNDKKYKILVDKYANKIRSQNKKKEINYLNTQVIEKLQPIIFKNISKDNNIINLDNRGLVQNYLPTSNNNIKISPRGISNNKLETNNINSQSFDRFVPNNIKSTKNLDFQTMVNKSSSNEVNNSLNSLEQFEKIKSQRNYEKLLDNTKSFENNIIKANEKIDDIIREKENNKPLEEDDFFKN